MDESQKHCTTMTIIQKKKLDIKDCGDQNQKMAGNGRLNFIESGKEAICIFMKILYVDQSAATSSQKTILQSQIY